ncbi:MAG: diguanylate cyclase [Thiotrichales bacterium]|mgnify:FL=1|jgi:diguanylate cyclase (GGDEF)-like protein|nr:diguanylate cyclase [Thiotrichales bacterium]MBT3614060.1 diguanylate cyclase [Thiotrichales bacterium]MBT3753290.1 diguanylate cyclase [Thiotrichales bacterium]MBT3836747.1 diguanylate cyclase [Thiotrichales bacterium]MBT4151499.1 diguanylate cyclase [Thiotrichales bacterium]
MNLIDRNNRTKNISVWLSAGFISLLILMSITIALSVQEINSLHKYLGKIVNQAIVKKDLVSQMIDANQNRAIIVLKMLYEDDPFEKDDLAIQFGEYAGDFMVAREKLMQMDLSPMELNSLRDSFGKSKIGTVAMTKIVELALSVEDITNEQQDELIKVMTEQTEPARKNVVANMNNIKRAADDSIAKTVVKAKEGAESALQLFWILALFMLIIASTTAFIIFRKVTAASNQLQFMYEQMDQLARNDGLTGLLNRRSFEEHLELSIMRAKRYHNSIAVLFLDLDGFKAVNDSLGHQAGDIVLQKVSALFLEQIRDVDTVARLGGDEFAVILNQPGDRVETEKVATRFLACLESNIELPAGESAEIGVSIGVAIFPKDGETEDELVQKADEAMYRSKKAGKNCLHFAETTESI